MIYKFTSIALPALCVTLLVPLIAQSQEAGSTASGTERQEAALEEIVVTARRRDESLQDIPISIMARSGEYLQRSRVSSMAELGRVVPGFVFDNYEGGGASTMSIRGLSTFSNQVAAQQSVGMLVDDVVISTIGQSVAEFNDINRVEVLRGPQGTLFGRNTTGGVVHIVTNDPSDEFEGKFSVTYGSYDKVSINGTINGPITEKLAARASFFSTNREGYLENIHDGRMLGNDQQVGVRTKFLYSPREDTRLKLSLTYVEREQEYLGSFGGQPIVAFGPAVTGDEIDFQVNQGIAGPKNSKINGVGYHPFDDEIAGASLVWEQAFGEFQMTSITAFEYWQWFFGKDNRTFNPPGDVVVYVRPFASTKLNGWSQEMRLASPSGRRLEYVVGGFASGTYSDIEQDFLFNVSGQPDPAAAIYLFDQEIAENDNLTYAFFGEADFHLTEEWTVTAGSRWTHEKTDVAVNGNAPPGFIPDFGIGIGELGEIYIPILNSEFPGPREDSVSDDEWSWRAGLRWQPSERFMFFSSVARGFKAPTISALGAFSIVRPEIATNYELGMKAGFLGNRILTSMAVFHTDVDDFQAEGQNSIETPQGTAIQIILKNAGEVRSRGVEFEFSAIPVDQLTFDLALAYIDAEFVSYPDASCFPSQSVTGGCIPSIADPTVSTQDLSGKRLPRTPEWSGNASVTYGFTLPFGELNHFVRLDYNYQSEINWSLGLAPLNESDPTGVLGLTLGLTSQDDRFELLGYVKNLTDEFVVNGMDGGNEIIRATLLPEYQRTWGITMSYRTP